MVELHPDLQALIGSVIHERYRVDGLLGQGGMGAVFRGHHLGLARDVAIKVLRPELGRSDSTAKRFDREAHSVSRLDHPNCVRVTDFGTTEGGVKYLVMELLEGAELEASLGRPWAPAQAVDTIVQVLEGLEHAHHVGIVHRDLKPENVFVTRDFRGREVVKLVDFGIAKLIDGQSAKDQLTRAGMVFGTPRYMSPEQASGGKLDERTDLYAAGLILYEMLAGQPPFCADEAAILLRMQILAPPPELPPSVPRPLAAVVAKLLEKSRNDRYASAREVVDALTQLRPTLEQAVAASPAVAGEPARPAVTPSMATQIDATSGTSWNAAAPPGASMGMPIPGPPAMPPGLLAPGPIAPGPIAPPSPAPAIPTPARSGGAWSPTPNTPTQASTSAPSHPSAALTQYSPVVAQPTPRRPARPWLPWVITAGAIMLALMAFGAGQALQADDNPTSDHEDARSAAEPYRALPDPDPFTRYDRECSNQERCELDCGEDCTARCTDAARCEISVGRDSRVLCEQVGKCEVRCEGDCRVECPQGGCKVTCPHPGEGKGKHKKPKPAKKCGSTYLCGEDCDGEREDDD